MIGFLGSGRAPTVSAKVGWGYEEGEVNDCRDLEFIFARGSGATRYETEEWREFQSSMEKVAKKYGLSYRIDDLNYPAVTVTNLVNLVGAYVSAGTSYNFGNSVKAGVSRLINEYRKIMASCPETRFVLGGYSQGAMVVGKAVKRMKAENVIYIGLFGDPELSLPEGEGIIPQACISGARSKYRVFAPNCFTASGVFGQRDPYEYGDLMGKYGLWCNAHDYVCGSTWRMTDMSGHTQYAKLHEIAWMAQKVDGRLSKQFSPVGRSVAKRTNGDGEDLSGVPNLMEYGLEAQAILDKTEYHVAFGEGLHIDASESWDSQGRTLHYWWQVDDKRWSTATQSWVEPANLAPGRHTLRLSLQADHCVLAEATAEIYVGEIVPESRIVAPTLAAVRRGDTVRVNWGGDGLSAVPSGAKLLLLRLNGVDLGYVELGYGEVTIKDFDFSQENILTLAWLDRDFRVGLEQRIDLNQLVDEQNEGFGGGNGFENKDEDVLGVDNGEETMGGDELSTPKRLDMIGDLALRVGTKSLALKSNFVGEVSNKKDGGASAGGLSSEDTSLNESDGGAKAEASGDNEALRSVLPKFALLMFGLLAFWLWFWLFWRRRKADDVGANGNNGGGGAGAQKYPPRRRWIFLEGRPNLR